MTRGLHKELRKIDDRIESDGLDAFDATARETVSEGLTSDDTRSRSRAARIVHNLPREATELVRELRQPLVEAIEAGLDDDAEDSDKRVSETAARALGPLANPDPEAVADLDTLAERLMEEGNPELRTAGAVLLTPLALQDLYEPEEKQVRHLIQHVILLESYNDNFTSRIDSMLPALIVLEAGVPAHYELISQIVRQEDGLPGSLGLMLEIKDAPADIDIPLPEDEPSTALKFERYLKAPHDKCRRVTTRFLATLAEHDSDAVRPYLLDLVTQLRDDEPQVVLQAGHALAQLGEEDVNQLQPIEHVLPAVLSHEEPPAVAGVLMMLGAVADNDPEWLGALPLDGVDDLQKRETIADEGPVRALAVKVTGQYGATEPAVIGENLVPFAFETLDTLGTPDKVFSQMDPVYKGIRAAIRSKPEITVPAVLKTGVTADTSEEVLIEAPKWTTEWVQMMREEEDSPQLSDDKFSLEMLNIILAAGSLARGLEDNNQVLEQCLSALLDEDEIPQRRFLAGMALIIGDLEAIDSEGTERLQTARDRFDPDRDGSFAGLEEQLL